MFSIIIAHIHYWSVYYTHRPSYQSSHHFSLNHKVNSFSSKSKRIFLESFIYSSLNSLIFSFRYYNLDDSVAREILGKKLSSRYRKDLDEVADRTGIRLKSCRRQFDNVKRIFKSVEELPGSVTNNIKQSFLLPDELARKYSVIVFIACLRFETAKRRLQYLDFSDFFECAQAIMTYWTYTYQHSGPEYYDTEMDREFLLDLREIRSLLDKEKEIKQ